MEQFPLTPKQALSDI